MTNYRRKRTLPKDRSPKFNINSQITASEVRLLDEENKMLGIMSLKEARELAESKELDLVEINPKSEPPVVKLVEYNKFKYQIQKANAKKAVKAEDDKQIRISVRISEHDMLVQTRKIDTFLEKGIKVKIRVRMERREKQHPEVAEETINKFISLIKHEFIIETQPTLNGDSYIATIKPKNK